MGLTHTAESTFASVLGRLLSTDPAEVPHDSEARRAWLSERGLGLAPIADPDDFAWAGPWIGVRADGNAVLMFGVPSGVLYAPDGASDHELVEGFVVAPLDVATWTPPQRSADPGRGTVEAIWIAPDATARMTRVDDVRAEHGRGLEGDRYWSAVGTFASGRPGSAVTLIDAAVLEQLGEIDHRRNLVVRGIDVNALVGREFTVGEVRCRGSRLAEPCAHLQRLNGARPVLAPLVHRGGLRADIVSSGRIRTGDPVIAEPQQGPAGAGE
jgi:hypothetical protein